MKYLPISALVLLLDQGSKLAAEAMLDFHRPVTLLPFFNLRLAYNPGAAFSFLSSAGGWQRWLFAGVSVAVIGLLLVWMRHLKADQKALAVAFALILGGAVGNLIDRLVYGHVIDFIDIYYRSWHWPTFNIADSAITIGAGLLILDAWRTHRREKAASRSQA